GVRRSRWQGHAVWYELSGVLEELKRRGGIRGSAHPVRRPVAPATRRCPARPTSAEESGVAAAGRGCGVGVPCWRGVGTRPAPDPAGVRSRPESSPGTRPGRCAPSVRRERWTESLTAPDESGGRVVRVTHPFHPLFGRQFEFVARRRNWARTGSTTT